MTPGVTKSTFSSFDQAINLALTIAAVDQVINNPLVQTVAEAGLSYLKGAIVGLITATSMHQAGMIFLINRLASSAIEMVTTTLAGVFNWTPETVNVLNTLTYAGTGVALILTLKSAGIIATLGIVIFSVKIIHNVGLQLSTKTTGRFH